MGICRLQVQGDSKLIIKQVQEEFILKEIAIVPIGLPFRSYSSLAHVQFEHMSRVHNRVSDALATMASKIDIPGEGIDVSIIRKTLRATATDMIPATIIDEQD